VPSPLALLESAELPANVDAERFVLGAIVTDGECFLEIAAALSESDFSVTENRLLFRRMLDLHERDEKIDSITVRNELTKRGELGTTVTLSYLCDLTDGLPQIYNLDSYVRIVQERSTRRRLIAVSQSIITRTMTATDDVREIISCAEESLLRLNAAGDADTGAMNPGEIIANFEGGINAFLDTSRQKPGISTGFLGIDSRTCGMRGGELIVLAARPSMGKTALALNIANYVATNRRTPRAVAIFSLEMSKQSLLTRLICSEARVDQMKFRSGFLTTDERHRLQQAAESLSDAPIFIADEPGLTLLDLRSKLRRLQSRAELGLVLVDYLQLMHCPKHENRVQEVSALSRGLKLLSIETDLPFLVLSQLSRAPETRAGDHRPMLSDARDSGSIEQDCDMMWFIYREEVYRPDKPELKGIAEVNIAKQRNGPTGVVKLAFLNSYTRFENLASGIDSSPFEQGYAA
jgi:replicative DNA helicase